MRHILLFSPSLCLPIRGQRKERGGILYSDRQSGQIPIENTSAWQLLDYLTLISLPPSIHSNHWLHFSIYFTINASGPTEQSSDESVAQSIRPAPRACDRMCVCAHVRACVCICTRGKVCFMEHLQKIKPVSHSLHYFKGHQSHPARQRGTEWAGWFWKMDLQAKWIVAFTHFNSVFSRALYVERG